MNYELLRVKTMSGPVVDLLDNLRSQDQVELQAMHQTQDLKGLVEKVLKEALWAILVVTEGQPCLLFGLTSDGDGGGCPWLIASKRLETDPKLRMTLARESKSWVDTMHLHYPLLWNQVHVDNHVSKKWLESLGFTLLPPSGAFQTFYKLEN